MNQLVMVAEVLGRDFCIQSQAGLPGVFIQEMHGHRRRQAPRWVHHPERLPRMSGKPDAQNKVHDKEVTVFIPL